MIQSVLLKLCAGSDRIGVDLLFTLSITKKSGFVNMGTCKHQFSHSAHNDEFIQSLLTHCRFQWVMLLSSETQLNILVPDLRLEPSPRQPKCDPVVSITGTGLGWLLGWSTVSWPFLFTCMQSFTGACVFLACADYGWKEWWPATVESQSKQSRLTFGCPSSQPYYSPIV